MLTKLDSYTNNAEMGVKNESHVNLSMRKV